MLSFPDSLDSESFLRTHWQKQPLFMRAAARSLKPQLTRNELGWLATLDDVESKIVFAEGGKSGRRYRVVQGPFDEQTLRELPKRDWTLLVHDVDKHLPATRKMFDLVPFIPDWRIDDLMVSFAAPGGGVGPHLDNYDVFLCQGIGRRDWQITSNDVAPDPAASNDLALLQPFADTHYSAVNGDVLYLPPGVAHWGTAHRACMTYSIGMRAPQMSDLTARLPDVDASNPFYQDPDLSPGEARHGYISPQAVARAQKLLARPGEGAAKLATRLGQCVTTTKEWLTPERPGENEIRALVDRYRIGGELAVHGMARLAWSELQAFVNGRAYAADTATLELFAAICAARQIKPGAALDSAQHELLRWMAKAGAFEIPEDL